MIETFGRKQGDVWEWYIRTATSRGGQNVYTMPEGCTNQFPSYEQLDTDGWILKIDPVGYDSALHNMVKGSFSDNGVNVWQNYKDKTSQELAVIAAAAAANTELNDETEASPLHGLTFDQAEAYIENNVIDLTSAKEVFKKLAKAILIINKKIGI